MSKQPKPDFTAVDKQRLIVALGTKNPSNVITAEIVRLVFDCQLQPGEARKLMHGDIEKVSGQPVALKVGGSTGRRVPLEPHTSQSLVDHLEWAKSKGCSDDDSDYLLRVPGNRTPIDESGVNRRIRVASKAIGKSTNLKKIGYGGTLYFVESRGGQYGNVPPEILQELKQRIGVEWKTVHEILGLSYKRDGQTKMSKAKQLAAIISMDNAVVKDSKAKAAEEAKTSSTSQTSAGNKLEALKALSGKDEFEQHQEEDAAQKTRNYYFDD
jgi:hypothetical protein